MTEQRPTQHEADLISIIAHDLRSPVIAARGFLELIEQSGPLTEQQVHFSGRATMALDRMERLIESLLELTRIDSGMMLNMAPMNMRELVDEVVDLQVNVAAQRGIVINITSKPTLRTVIADRSLIEHVVGNLVSNAIKYNKNDGRVDITISDQSRVLRVDVRDTGIGIPETSLPYIFDRFYRAHKTSEIQITGTGLGLAICKSIIEMHNGKIWAESKSGEGSRFSFTLPFRAEREQGLIHRQMSLLHPEVAGELDDPIDDDTQESEDIFDSDSRDDAP